MGNFLPKFNQRMNCRLLVRTFVLIISLNSFGQEEGSVKSRSFFGLSLDIGGGLELDDDKYTSGQMTPSSSPNLGVGLFWKRYWYFSGNNGLIFGGGVNWLTFSRAVAYEYTVNTNPQSKVTDHLGNGFRNSVFSIDLPVYYTHRFKSKKGEFNQYVGVTVRTIAGLVDEGITTGGTGDIEHYGSTYFSDYTYTLGLSRVAPIILPTLGFSWGRPLENGAMLNFSIDYKVYLEAFSKVEARYENTFRSKGGVVLTPSGPEPVESIPVDYTTDNFKVDLSGFSVGISYSFK